MKCLYGDCYGIKLRLKTYHDCYLETCEFCFRVKCKHCLHYFSTIIQHTRLIVIVMLQIFFETMITGCG